MRYYLAMQTEGLPRFPAPLDVTMRRAAVMMKPYFRNCYPLSSQLFYVAIGGTRQPCESQVIAGNAGQEAALRATIGTMWRDLIPEAKRPKRMVLSREVMAMSCQPGDERLASKFSLPHPGMDPAGHARTMAAMQAKMMPGMQPGEAAGSLHDAMLAGWRQKHGAMPDVPPLDMTCEPVLPAQMAAR